MQASGIIRLVALALLGLDVCLLLCLAAVSFKPSEPYSAVGGVFILLGAVVTACWAAVFSKVSKGEDVPAYNKFLMVLRKLYPYYTAVNFFAWGIFILGLLLGASPVANPIAEFLMALVWVAGIISGNAINSWMTEMAKAERVDDAQYNLQEWLNWYAALSVAMAVISLVPIKGLNMGSSSQAENFLYAASGIVDAAAMLFAMHSLKRLDKPTPQK